MLYEMLLGRTPFRADTPAATLMAHVHRPLPLPTTINPSIQPRLESLLLKALAKSADDRFQSAGEMIQALKVASGMEAPPPIGEVDATAVMDTVGLDTSDLDAATAVIGSGDVATGASAPAPPGSPVAPPRPQESTPPASKTPIIVGGGMVAAVVAVAIVGFVAFSGGGSGEDAKETQALTEAVLTAVATAAPTAAPAVPTAVPPTAAPPTAVPTVHPCAVSVAAAAACIDDVLDRVKESVPALRQLTPDQEIEIELKTKEQLASINQKFLARKSLRDQIFETQELYKALDLMEEDQDLEDIVTEISLQ